MNGFAVWGLVTANVAMLAAFIAGMPGVEWMATGVLATTGALMIEPPAAIRGARE